MLYQAYQAQRDLTAPARAWAGLARWSMGELPDAWTDNQLSRRLSAVYEMVGRSRLTHERPPFGIDEVTVAGRPTAVREEVALATPFSTLLHFAKDDITGPQPVVLLVTALAGHFSTLLRSTIRSLVADHDVYVTDWLNARDVGVEHGAFGFDDYVGQLVTFLEHIGPGTHLMAVCQPCPAALSAASLMAAADNPAQPKSLVLMAGPVDTRVSPTKVNELAHSKPINWFEQNVIATVPFRYRGATRRVYPGFIQVSGFVAMNLGRHVQQQIALYNDLVRGDYDEAKGIEDFYDEYFAVLDMPAEFYLETVERVFQRELLAHGQLTWRGVPIEPGAICRTALLTVEGEKDDVCGIGQTMAAQALCSGIKPSKKRHHLQPGVGHYGVFSGSRWEKQIYPIVRNFILAND
ncbi:MAG: polyhydroxyalkanoate depolymerase [Acidimicrobiales bacterium]|jgi:poly(3-hydroxybutyrate) depolymerase